MEARTKLNLKGFSKSIHSGLGAVPCEEIRLLILISFDTLKYISKESSLL